MTGYAFGSECSRSIFLYNFYNLTGMLSFPGGFAFIIIDTHQKDFAAIVLQTVRIMFSQDLVYGALCAAVPFQLDHHRRPVGILLWQIDDVRIPFPGGQLLPLQVMIPVGIVCQLDHASKAGFFVVMQRRGLLPVHLPAFPDTALWPRPD